MPLSLPTAKKKTMVSLKLVSQSQSSTKTTKNALFNNKCRKRSKKNHFRAGLNPAARPNGRQEATRRAGLLPEAEAARRAGLLPEAETARRGGLVPEAEAGTDQIHDGAGRWRDGYRYSANCKVILYKVNTV